MWWENRVSFLTQKNRYGSSDFQNEWLGSMIIVYVNLEAGKSLPKQDICLLWYDMPVSCISDQISLALGYTL